MIDIRKYSDISKWLKTYPNLGLVSRNGEIFNKKAINNTDNNIVKVSDRFDILKN